MKRVIYEFTAKREIRERRAVESGDGFRTEKIGVEECLCEILIDEDKLAKKMFSKLAWNGKNATKLCDGAIECRIVGSVKNPAPSGAH